MSAPDPLDPRAEAARAWALQCLGLPQAGFAPASADASFRRYFRVTEPGGRSWVVMDAPPEHENCRPFIAIARQLRRWGLHAPEVLAEDLPRGYLLLGDLGRDTLLRVLTPANADAHFGDVLRALVRMQRQSLDDPMPELPPYDAALLWREVRLFSDWYLPRHLGVALDGTDAGTLEAAMGLLVKSALAQPRCFVHRDFMPRNLMVSDPPPGILDFQDAVHGPITYDAICLFKDAFLSWPEERVEGWLEQYAALARGAGLPLAAGAEFRRQADWMGLQRHLKVLGIFARLSYRDGKAHYVADTPRFVRYVMDVLPRYAELAPLARLFDRHVLPKVSL